MRSDHEIGRQAPRTCLCGLTSPLCIACETPASFEPNGLSKHEVDGDASIRQEAIDKRFLGLRMGQQFGVNRRSPNQASFGLGIAEFPSYLLS